MQDTPNRAGSPFNWREVLWWAALLVLMGAILALATWANAG